MLDGGTTGGRGEVAITLGAVSVATGTTRILDAVDLRIRAGAPTAIIGPNGSGKTTLLRAIMGLVAPSAGHVAVLGPARDRAARCALVFQKPVMLKRSAAANVTYALAAAGHRASGGAALRLLERVGLASIADRPARRLSGGEQQRLALARALAREPDVLLLDEPTASLDPAQAKSVEDTIKGIAREGVKVVLATHDLGQARRLAGDIVLMVGGRVAEHTSMRSFFDEPRTDAARRFIAGELIT